jgi:hypothetical protein
VTPPESVVERLAASGVAATGMTVAPSLEDVFLDIAERNPR